MGNIIKLIIKLLPFVKWFLDIFDEKKKAIRAEQKKAGEDYDEAKRNNDANAMLRAILKLKRLREK